MKHKEVYTCYSPEGDITFIMEDTYKNNEIISTEVKGFYYGETDEKANEVFYGKTKAKFDWRI